MTPTVRDATPAAAATILRFVRELADYEKAIHEVEGQRTACAPRSSARDW